MEASRIAENKDTEEKNIDNSQENVLSPVDIINISNAAVPVCGTSCQPTKEQTNNCNTLKCQCVKASDSSPALPPCYFCSSKAAELFIRTQNLPQIKPVSSLPSIRNHSDHVVVRGFSSSNSFRNNFICPYNYPVHENHSASCPAREERCSSPTGSQANKTKDMPKIAAIFCKHRVRKIFLSIPIGILATIGILGIDTSFATIFNVSILLIILFFYPLFCLLDYGLNHLSSRLKIMRKIRTRKRTESELSEDTMRSISDGDTHRRPSYSSRLSVISNLPSIAEEDDDDRTSDVNQHTCSTVAEHSCRECERQRSNSMCASHSTSNIHRGITICIPRVIVQ